MSLQSLLPENHKTALLGRMEGWENTELTSCSDQRLGTDRPYVGAAWGLPPRSQAPPSPCDSVVCSSTTPWNRNCICFEADVVLIREALPFMCLSPACRVLFTWTVCSPGVPRAPPLLRYGGISRNWIQARPPSAAFCLVFLPTSWIATWLGEQSPGWWQGAAPVWKEFPYFTNALSHIEGRWIRGGTLNKFFCPLKLQFLPPGKGS